MRSRWAAVGLLCAVLFLGLTIAVAAHATDVAEMALVRAVVDGRSWPVTVVIQTLTFITSAAPAFALACAASLWAYRADPRRRWSNAWPALAFLGALVCNIAIRILIGRLRPAVDYLPNWLPEIQAGFQRWSFPSGHAGAALMSWAGLAWAVSRRRRLPAWAAIAAVLIVAGTGVGRFYLGVHWPTDVLGGYLLAGAWVCAGMAWAGWEPVK